MTPTPVIVYEKKHCNKTHADIPDIEKFYYGVLVETVVVANYIKFIVRNDVSGFFDIVDHEYVRDSRYAGIPA